MNRRSAVLTVAPAQEPVSLLDVKAFLRIDGTDDDTLLTSLIVTARRLCEDYTKRAFITQTWKTTLDRFPEEKSFWRDIQWRLLPRCEQYAIQLSRQNIQSIVSIKTTDRQNVQSTVAEETYTLDQSSGRVLLNDGYFWPCELREFAAVEITTTNGYGDDGGDVEPVINQAIMQTIGAFYESRSCSDIPEGVKSLLAPYMLPEAFACGF